MVRVMKIIKHGKYFKDNFIYKCGSCGCEFELENDDLDLRYSMATLSYSYYFKCPECGRLHFIGADDI